MSESRSARPTFRRVVQGASQALLVKPALQAYLWEARFPKRFSVEFWAKDTVREPDGWFHPSEQPLWSERMLWLWAHHPEKAVPEPLGVEGALSVTIGKAVHSFIQVCLDDLGLLIEGERHVENVELNSKGEMDWVLGLVTQRWGPEVGGEFKTGNVFQVGKLKDLDLEHFKATWPHYWAQVQNYMMLSGLTMFVVIFISLGFPWEIREVQVPRDEIFIEDLARRYRRAMEDEMPQACCSPMTDQARTCPMRHACPIGLASLSG